jgi:hypothetical protein
LPSLGGPGTRDGPAWVGVCSWRAATGRRKIAASVRHSIWSTGPNRACGAAPHPQRIVARRPRTRASFQPSAVGVAGGVQVRGVHPPDPWTSSPLGLDACAPAFTRAERSASEKPPSTLDPHRRRIAEQVHDCPPGGGDGGYIAWLNVRGNTILRIFSCGESLQRDVRFKPRHQGAGGRMRSVPRIWEPGSSGCAAALLRPRMTR